MGIGKMDGTVFILDDDPSVLKSLARLIRVAGWNVEAYSSGREFLARLPSAGKACIVLDLTMPDLTGLEICDRMASILQGPSLPTIFLTGGDDVNLRARVTHHPHVNLIDFLTKPVNGEVLMDSIRRALAS
jgi:FixJ family two-component response regulator